MTRSKSSLVSLRDLWDQFGKMLFDVKSQTCVHEYSAKGLCFDESLMKQWSTIGKKDGDVPR